MVHILSWLETTISFLCGFCFQIQQLCNMDLPYKIDFFPELALFTYCPLGSVVLQ